MTDIDKLAQEIRRIDGSNNLGAAALSEALMPFLEAIMADREKRLTDPERMMKDALFALIDAGRETAQYGGVLCGDGKYAWMRFSVEPKAAPEPVNVKAEKNIDAGRFDEWSLADFADQCRMQSREQLDPEFSAFMAALGNRITTLSAPESVDVDEVIERIAAWIEPQRNGVPMTGEEAAGAIRALKGEAK